MRVISRATFRQIVPFAPLVAVAVLNLLIVATDSDVVAAPSDGAISDDASVLLPIGGTTPVRPVVPARMVSGSEDPEGFDQAGVERWWHDYQISHSLRAENTKR